MPAAVSSTAPIFGAFGTGSDASYSDPGTDTDTLIFVPSVVALIRGTLFSEHHFASTFPASGESVHSRTTEHPANMLTVSSETGSEWASAIAE